jgi:succinate dehydrogenase/fumarate reductase flavoprotein subunit
VTDAHSPDWDRTVDLLVAGAGPGGMTAALVAALNGLDVLICEKSEQVGGTGATSAGTLWIPGNSQGRAAGFDDKSADADAYLGALTGHESDPRRDAFLADGPRIIDDLVARTAIEFVSCGHHPDYRNNLPGSAEYGRAIIPAPFDGRKLGRDFDRVRPPIEEYLLLGGMMVGKMDIEHLLGRYKSLGNFGRAAALVLRYMADRLRFSRGTRLVMGNALVAQLYYSLKQHSVPILFGTAFEDLVQEDGRVTGAVLSGAGGAQRVRARNGVVLATGGFAHDARRRTTFMPSPVPAHSMAVPENTGDGLAMAEKAGGRLSAGSNEMGGLWSPVSVTRRKDGSAGLYPHILLDRAKPGLIAVNRAGRRFVNEGVSYHDFVEAMYRANETDPAIPAWLICDVTFVRKYGLGAIHPGTRNIRKFEKDGYLISASGIAALAGKLEIDPEGLTETVARHNRFARDGDDPDFGKGSTVLNRFNGDPENQPNPCLGPIATPPFIAMAVWPAEIACSSGLATDENARVLKDDGSPIGGLYACGNDMASIMEGHYPGPGTTLGPAMVFGYRAALHAAGQRAGNQ